MFSTIMYNMDKDYIAWAMEIKNSHPLVLVDFSPFNIARVWCDYSHDVSAHWLDHNGLDDAAIWRVFQSYKIIDGKLMKEID